MWKTSISTVILLAIAVWLAYPLVKPSRHSVDYSVVAQTLDQERSFVIRDATIAPGGSLGWHWHKGTVIAYVKEGTLHHYRSDCVVDAVYQPGDWFAEPAGPEHVHDGRNLGPTPVILEVIYIVRASTPLAEEASTPNECQSTP